MAEVRIITRLDIKGPNVVNGVHTEGLRVIGSPGECAKKYYQQGADDIIYYDIVASLYERDIDTRVLEEVANNIFIPLTVGGGLKSIDDIERVLRAGADKVALNTYAIRNPNILKEAVRHFGSQCITLAVDAKRISEGRWEPYIEGGRERTCLDALDWIRQGLDFGIGEIMATSIDNDGTRTGYEIPFIEAVMKIATVPVIAHGGAAGPESAYELFCRTKVDAISAASMFHEDNVSVADVKSYLRERGVSARYLL